LFFQKPPKYDTLFLSKPRLCGGITLWRVLPISINSKNTLEENREEAVKLFISIIQPTMQSSHLIQYGDLMAKEVILGAQALMDYILHGTINHPTTSDQDCTSEDASPSQPIKQPLKKLFK
jgi:hypothetical protein